MPRKFSPSLILRLSGVKYGSVPELFRKAVSVLCWQATPEEIREFVNNAPINTGWFTMIKYCKEWMTVEE